MYSIFLPFAQLAREDTHLAVTQQENQLAVQETGTNMHLSLTHHARDTANFIAKMLLNVKSHTLRTISTTVWYCREVLVSVILLRF